MILHYRPEKFDGINPIVTEAYGKISMSIFSDVLLSGKFEKIIDADFRNNLYIYISYQMLMEKLKR